MEKARYKIGSECTLISTFYDDPKRGGVFLVETITPNIDSFQTGTHEELTPEKAEDLKSRDGNIIIEYESSQTVKNIAEEIIEAHALADRNSTIKWVKDILNRLELQS